MRTVLIVQARMTSSRLPGKILLEAAGKPLLVHLIERLKKVTQADAIVVATTTNASDDIVETVCEQMGVGVHRGPEHDVLSRYAGAAEAFEADIVVRITSDCPMLDPRIVDQYILRFKTSPLRPDYVWCGEAPKLPVGMGVEVFSRAALDAAHARAADSYDREHVTPFIRRADSGFTVESVGFARDLHDYRLCVDVPEDFSLVERVLRVLAKKTPDYDLDDIIALLDANPHWRTLNAAVIQTTGPYATAIENRR
jgi:spore coat polysaccharide biosynthesis protein SpsF